MKILKSEGAIKASVVCCVHGDEPFGKSVFDYYSSRMDRTEGLQLILANEEALEKGERFVDTDLNRCFPGKPDGNSEERLAYQILELVEGSDYVIDVHTTTSGIVMTPIVTNLGKGVRQILNLCNSLEVAHMNNTIAKGSLIGSVQAAVSLEFEEKYAETAEALETVVKIIDSLIAGVAHSYRPRAVLLIDRIIPLELRLPDDAANFIYIESLGIHPFLLGERAYMDFQGFAAAQVKKILI